MFNFVIFNFYIKIMKKKIQKIYTYKSGRINGMYLQFGQSPLCMLLSFISQFSASSFIFLMLYTCAIALKSTAFCKSHYDTIDTHILCYMSAIWTAVSVADAIFYYCTMLLL